MRRAVNADQQRDADPGCTGKHRCLDQRFAESASTPARPAGGPQPHAGTAPAQLKITRAGNLIRDRDHPLRRLTAVANVRIGLA